jgi:hypothetical protein
MTLKNSEQSHQNPVGLTQAESCGVEVRQIEKDQLYDFTEK